MNNNMNDAPGGRAAGAGDGNLWYYVALVPMLALAVCRSVWKKESQKEIQKVTVQCDKDVYTIAVAKQELELELQMERLKFSVCNVALISQRERLMEEQRQLRQRAALDAWHQRVTTTLKELEFQLMERQNAYCSYIRNKSRRLEMEKNMLRKVVEDPIEADLDLESDLKDIFKRDNHCAALSNMDKRENGKLMWVYLKYWQLQVTVQKHKRAEEAILGGKIQSHTK